MSAKFSLQRQPIIGRETEVEELERQAVPITEVYGSLPERIIYRELTRRRAVFSFHQPIAGTYGVAGALIVDFYLYDRPLIIEVYGVFIHERGALRDPDRENRIRELEPDKELAIIWDWEIYNREFRERWLTQNVDAALLGAPVRVEYGEEG
jgi:hypothetical protein